MNAKVDRAAIRVFAVAVTVHIRVTRLIQKRIGSIGVVLGQIVVLCVHFIIEVGLEELAQTRDMTLRRRVAVCCQIDDRVAVQRHREGLTEGNIAKRRFTRVQVDVDQVVRRIPVAVVFRVRLHIGLVDISDKVGAPVDLACHQRRLDLGVVRILTELDAIQIGQPLIRFVVMRVAANLDLVVAHGNNFGNRTGSDRIRVLEGQLVLDTSPDMLRHDPCLFEIPVKRGIRTGELDDDRPVIRRSHRLDQPVGPLARFVERGIFSAKVERKRHVLSRQRFAIGPC